MYKVYLFISSPAPCIKIAKCVWQNIFKWLLAHDVFIVDNSGHTRKINLNIWSEHIEFDQFFYHSVSPLRKKNGRQMNFTPILQAPIVFFFFFFFFVSPELSSERDYVITHSVRSMYIVCIFVYVCMYVVFCKIDHCIHIHWCIVMGLGHNDPWVESHMWPQQTWGQRSSRGQWPLVQFFGKKGQCIHILWSEFSNLILQWLQKYVIAKSGETHGSRTALVPPQKKWFLSLLSIIMIKLQVRVLRLKMHDYLNVPLCIICTPCIIWFRHGTSGIFGLGAFRKYILLCVSNVNNKKNALLKQNRCIFL